MVLKNNEEQWNYSFENKITDRTIRTNLYFYSSYFYFYLLFPLISFLFSGELTTNFSFLCFYSFIIINKTEKLYPISLFRMEQNSGEAFNSS